MRDWVAVILALTVFVLMVPRALAALFNAGPPTTPEEAALWRDILLVTIGVLANYVGGGGKPPRIGDGKP